MAESKLAELVARPLCLYNESCLYIFICITGNKICLNHKKQEMSLEKTDGVILTLCQRTI